MKKIIGLFLALMIFSSSAWAAKALVNIQTLESDGSGQVSIYYQVAIKQGANSGKYFSGGTTLDLSKTLANIRTDLKTAIKNDAQNVVGVTLTDGDLIMVGELI